MAGLLDQVSGERQRLLAELNYARSMQLGLLPAPKRHDARLAELNRLIEDCRGAYENLNFFLPSNRCFRQILSEQLRNQKIGPRHLQHRFQVRLKSHHRCPLPGLHQHFRCR